MVTVDCLLGVARCHKFVNKEPISDEYSIKTLMKVKEELKNI